jgi:hypothetical protein
MIATLTFGWLPRVLVGGGLLLLLTRLLLGLSAQPARRQRLGEWGMAAALLLLLLSLVPAWILVPIPGPEPPADPASEKPLIDSSAPITWEVEPQPELTDFALLPDFGEVPAPEDAEAPRDSTPPRDVAEPAAEREPVSDSWHDLRESGFQMLGVIYAGGAAFFLGRWLLGHIGLHRLLRAADPAPVRAARLFAEMHPGRARLRTSRRARVPFSCGLLRPTVVLPAELAETATDEALRWVIAHELTHLRRHDAVAGLLFGLGQAAYYVLPWFWSLRRCVRLSQEQVADAAAAEGRPEDYAQFLLTWTTSPALPAGALGVMGRTSDLFRRVTMLLQSPAPVERRCPRRWSLAAASLLVPAVLVAGLGFHAIANPASAARADDVKKDEPKKDDRGQPPVAFPDVEEILKNLPPGADRDEVRKQLMEVRERLRKMMENRTLPPGGGFGRPGAPGEFGRFGGGGIGGGAPFGGSDLFGGSHQGRLGALVERPNSALADQLDLPKDTGLILQEVRPDSPAAKAGLKTHDVLLELNGKPVPNDPAKFVRMFNDVKADTKLDVVVLRKGRKEIIRGLTLPEAKDVGRGPGRGGFGGVAPPGGFPGGGGGAGFAGVPGPGGFPGGPGGGGGLGGLPGGGLIGMAGGGGFSAGKSVMTTTLRTPDHFTTRYQEGSLIITVTGKVADGKGKAGEITVQDGRETNKYESVDKVPEQYRDKVKNLVEMSEKSGARIEIK